MSIKSYHGTSIKIARSIIGPPHSIDVTKGKGFGLPSGELIRVNKANGGDVGDLALLCSSPQEHGAGGNARLPFALKEELAKFRPTIPVFNPRGQDFANIAEVRRLGGSG